MEYYFFFVEKVFSNLSLDLDSDLEILLIKFSFLCFVFCLGWCSSGEYGLVGLLSFRRLYFFGSISLTSGCWSCVVFCAGTILSCNDVCTGRFDQAVLLGF